MHTYLGANELFLTYLIEIPLIFLSHSLSPREAKGLTLLVHLGGGTG